MLRIAAVLDDRLNIVDILGHPEGASFLSKDLANLVEGATRRDKVPGRTQAHVSMERLISGIELGNRSDPEPFFLTAIRVGLGID